MSESPFIHEASLENFQALVLEASFQQPVLVDFWADWCNPCQMLMPILAKLADEYQGKFQLVKVNSDQNQQLAMQFGVRSLPTVKLFKDGQPVDEFMGALPESEIRSFLDRHITSATDEVITVAMQAYQSGQKEEALALLNQALQADPGNAVLKINIAQLVSEQGDNESALALLDSLNAEEQELPPAKALRGKIQMSSSLEGLPPRDELVARIEQDANDLTAIHQLSQYCSAEGNYAGAMELLLQIMKTDRGYEDDIGRRGLLELFDVLGNEHPDAQHYRRKMFALLH